MCAQDIDLIPCKKFKCHQKNTQTQTKLWLISALVNFTKKLFLLVKQLLQSQCYLTIKCGNFRGRDLVYW